MAQLDVQLKKSNSWWLWLLLALIVLGVLIFLLRGCNGKGAPVSTTDSTMRKSDTVSKGAVASTQPDWNSVDFNAASIKDADVNDKDIMVNGNDKYTIYTLGENILFAPDQSTLQGTADQKLKEITASLGKRFSGANIGVFGNTDSTGNTGHNTQLGAQRAAAVKDWLVKNANVDPSRLSVHSNGAAKPVASNATGSGRQQNRNVEIVAFRGN